MMEVVLWVATVGYQDVWEWEIAGCSHRTVYLGKRPIRYKDFSGPRSRKQTELPSASHVKCEASLTAEDNFEKAS